MDQSLSKASSDARRIKRLDDSVVNRIAAGEIIVQPANALKELLENSIDAGSTMIEILVKEGGLKLLQITDNGHGIDKDDMKILCERFTTSKIEKYDDLERISTYGFRGEALASISHISRLSVTSKTKVSPLAYKCQYVNGQLANSNGRSDPNAEPKPVAGKDGTQITVEDLFYNVPSRLKSFRSKSDEFSKIVDVVTRYAVHTKRVGFSCKKFGEPYLVLSTRPQATTEEKIRTLYGSEIASELLSFNLTGDELSGADGSPAQDFGLLEVTGFVSNASYLNKKKITHIFFINDRLVSCNPLKRIINSVYQFFLPKGSHPFVYLSLKIKPENIDVNIHPTKRELRFLYEDEIMETIRDKIHLLLAATDSSRKFRSQNAISSGKRRPDFEETDSSSYVSQQRIKKYRQENRLVRVDALQAKLESFLNKESTAAEDTQSPGDDQNLSSSKQDDQVSVGPDASMSQSSYSYNDTEWTDVKLSSIISLRKMVSESVDRDLTSIFSRSSYVGVVDEKKRLCCFQSDVRLYVCDYGAVLKELFYQVALENFMNYGEIHLGDGVALEQILLALYQSTDEQLKPIEEVILLIWDMKEMFETYFKIKVYEHEGEHRVSCLPLIAKDITFSMSKLPFFFYRLGSLIDYEDEKTCLEGIIRELALLHIPEPLASDEGSEDSSVEHDNNLLSKKEALEHYLEHRVFPLIKQKFLAPKEVDSAVVQIADLPGLYKVFERC